MYTHMLTTDVAIESFCYRSLDCSEIKLYTYVCD